MIMSNNVMDSANAMPDKDKRLPESAEKAVDFYKELLGCSKLLSIDVKKIFGEDFKEDNICSFIRRVDGCKDFLIIDKGMVYLIPFTLTDEKDRIEAHLEMKKVLGRYNLSSQKRYTTPNQLDEYLIGGIMMDARLEMKSIHKDEKKIYEFIDDKKSRTIAEYKKIGELSGVKSDYPFDSRISICVNGIEYTSQFHPGMRFYYDTVVDFLGNGVTDAKKIGKFYSNSWVLSYVNTFGEIFIVKYSKENKQRLLDCGYREQSMLVPFSSGTEDFFGFDTFYKISNP